ncbi:MAG: hypothetical protein IJ935_17240 [Afipia sp.]|nr:hypothetical protein [Afipia sp.]
MLLKNQNIINRNAAQLLERVTLIFNQDGRLRISNSIYKADEFMPSVKELLRALIEFNQSSNHDYGVKLLTATRSYIRTVDKIFERSRPRFLTSMRSAGGPSFVNAYKDAVSLEKILGVSIAGDEFAPINLPEQKPSPIYARVEGQKIVLDSGKSLHPLLSVSALDRTKAYLKEELSQLVAALRSSNVDRRIVAEFSKLISFIDFEDDAGAIILGLHARKVMQIGSMVEQEVSSVLSIQITSTLMQVSHFSSQYKDWVDFIRNALQYSARDAVEDKIDGAVKDFIEILASNPNSIDQRIPEVVKSIEGSLAQEEETRAGAIYALIRGFENICIVAVKFAFDEANKLVSETAKNIRGMAAKALAVTVVGLALTMIYSFMPVINVAPELSWITEIISKIEKIKDILK